MDISAVVLLDTLVQIVKQVGISHVEQQGNMKNMLVQWNPALWQLHYYGHLVITANLRCPIDSCINGVPLRGAMEGGSGGLSPPS